MPGRTFRLGPLGKNDQGNDVHGRETCTQREKTPSSTNQDSVTDLPYVRGTKEGFFSSSPGTQDGVTPKCKGLWGEGERDRV